MGCSPCNPVLSECHYKELGVLIHIFHKSRSTRRTLRFCREVSKAGKEGRLLLTPRLSIMHTVAVGSSHIPSQHSGRTPDLPGSSP